MGNIIILHSALSAASMAFLGTLGVTIPEGDDVTVAIGNDTVRIIADHAQAVATCPAFPGYPAAVCDDAAGQRHCLYDPPSLAAVTAWRETLDTSAAPSPPRYTQAEFMRLFTQDELDAVLAAEATDLDIKRMWAFIRAVGYVSMADPLTVNSLLMLREKGYIPTDERLQQIKDGVFQL